MTPNTELLFRMMEHPELYSTTEWQKILSDKECSELYTMMAKLQSTSCYEQAEQIVDDETMTTEWQRLRTGRKNTFLQRAAAVVTGLFLLSGLAVAIILWQQHNPFISPQAQENDTTIQPAQNLQTAEVGTDTILFDNTTLENVLNRLTNYYGIRQVEYRADNLPALRLYYQWTSATTKEEWIDQLDHFETFHLHLHENTLIVEPRHASVP